MDSTNIVTPTVTAVPRNEKTMHGEDFSSLTGSSFDRQFLLSSDSCPNFRFNANLILFNVSQIKRAARKTRVAILFVLEIILRLQKLCVALITMVAFILDLSKLYF